MFFGWAGLVLAALALVGGAWAIVAAARRRRPEGAGEAARPLAPLDALLYAAAFALGLAFATVYDILDIRDYLAVPIFMACVVAGVGIAATSGVVAALAGGRIPRLAVGAVTLVVGAVLTWAAASSSRSHTAVRVDFSGLDVRSYWAPVMAADGAIPRHAHIIADWPQANEARYLQRAEGWRPDLDIVVADYVVATGSAPIDRWLQAREPVFMIGEEGAIFQDFTTERQGALWRVVARASEQDRPAPPMAHALNRRYGDAIVLLGYTLDPDPPVLVPGGLLRITLYWKALKPVSERYVVFNHLVDAAGAKYGQKDDEPGRGLKATVSWTAGEVITDTMPLAVSPNAPPGTYRLMTGLYTRLGERRLQAFDADGASLGDYPLLSDAAVRAGHR
jgi:hypothetical protein